MQTINPIDTRALALDCFVVQACSITGVVLCKKNTDRDDAFVTWKYFVKGGEAEFYWGHYDMDLSAGAASYAKRVNEGLGK